MTYELLVKNIAKKIEENKDYLCDLDSKIGDGDHGTNVSRALNKTVEALDSFAGLTLDQKIGKTAMLLISNVGGASGPLLGTWLMAFSKKLKDQELNVKTFLEAFSFANENLKTRGKTEYRNKTMYDILYAAELATKQVSSLSEFAKVAYEAALKENEYTKGIAARSGRASYLGERSIGVNDAGSTTICLILEVLNAVVNG
ncbi:dihydroxyacetone kinase subunit DhaL [Mycoplasmopsis alligatoris]|uniref:Dihydroxyacetone kinase, L subunit n=1 Tax=Mycoplasmopsis alligatoris A21JP2 TaxID=747682 RepID=D4XUY8_9BACT|nr:dihydroxyacetone kinase subunit DhaL [Mycoplasmopsis alligatoris]EFF41813.1 dihydroxyacetone kinase, L subunit [Mycoplasmopsis alligatoris A21JP2]